MSFAQPAVLLLLLLIPPLVGLKIWGDMRSRRAAGKMVSSRLLPDLLVPRGKTRSLVVFLMEMAAVACFVTALARPQYGYVEEEAPAGGRNLIIAIDTSKSMLADDLKPSRLQRAQLAATDLIKRLRGDRIGLMPFAGNAFMYAPVTPDTDALLESVDSLDTEIIPRGGSNLARPIDLAVETFAKTGAAGQQVLILFSDGESLEGETLAAAKRAAAKKLTIICIGVGTQSGGTIPDPEAPGGYHRDRDGKVVVTRLEREALVSIANATHGLYLPLDGNEVNDTRVDVILSKIERSDMKGKVTKISIDRYRWPLGAGLILLLGSWIAGITRRHLFQRSRLSMPPPLPPAATAVVVATALLTALFPRSASAAPAGAGELKIGNPWEFYRQGDYKAAQGNFEKRLESDARSPGDSRPDPVLAFGRGAAAYKNKEYDIAVDAFGAAVLSEDLKLRAQAHYNLANAIYQRASELVKKAKPNTLSKLTFVDGLIRQLENSLENYQQSLILDPGNADTQANHDTTDELIQKLRKLRKKLAEQQGQGKGKKKGKKKGKQKGEGSPGQGAPGGEGEGESGQDGPNGRDRQGKGHREPGDEGEEGDEEGEEEGGGPDGKNKDQEGSGGESKEEREAREKSNQEREGDIGSSGGNGAQPGEDPGKEPKNLDEPAEDSDQTGGSSGSDASNLLDQYSDEDTTVRPRVETAPEPRPRKDW